MSSTVTSNSVHQGKLLVHLAESGHSFEYDCDETTLVEEVMQFIGSEAGINFNDQLVLCSGLKLEAQRPLSVYKLPSNDQEVFVYNKARLQTNSPPPPPEQIDLVDIAEPQPPPSSQDPHPLDDASDPALQALASYERLFRYHYQYGYAIYHRSLGKYKICERLCREKMVQQRALDVAWANLDQYYRVINQAYMEFMKRFSYQHRMHSDLLAKFERDIERLRSLKLHPRLQTDTRRCLLDFVKEDNLRKSAANCSSSHRQFENKVSQFNRMFDEVKQKVEELNSIRLSLSLKNWKLIIKEHQQYVNEQKSILQSLSKDVSTVKKLVDDCLSPQLPSSMCPYDAISALGPMYILHDKSHLQKMQACDQSISKLLELSKDKKNEMNIFVHNYMQKTAYVSYIVKDVKLQFPVFREAMMHQDDLFVDLKLVRSIGPAYRACLAEVVRRKESMKLYMGKAGELAERLATEREFEMRRREDFQKLYGSYIPMGVIISMGLDDIPNQCDVYVAPFDTKLLDIGIWDVDHYAPEYLVGPSSKIEKHGSSGGSFLMSNDNPRLAETEGSASEDLERDEPKELLGVSELDEIAGTSKIEVENAKLKAELASAKAFMCSLCPEVDFELMNDSQMSSLLKNSADKAAEALRLKDEYAKLLQSLLKSKQMQCVAYEKRIQELEQRLSDQYFQGQNLSKITDTADFPHPNKKESSEADISHEAETHMPCRAAGESMDEISSISNSLATKLESIAPQPKKPQERLDINMIDSSGMLDSELDSSMVENHEEPQVGDTEGKEKNLGQLGISETNSCTGESVPESFDVLPRDPVVESSLGPEVSGDVLLELKSALAEKSNQLSETETKLKSALEEVVLLSSELELSRKLLNESQMNCAHLENCLHEARKEAQTHLCGADHKASEDSALRVSTVKMQGLYERLRSCISAPGGVAGFADSLCILSQSFSNSVDGSEDDIAEFQRSIKLLADRVSFLYRHHNELLERYPKIVAASAQLRNNLEEKTKLIRTLSTKHQHEKQASKEKISFGLLEVHQIAAFVLNSAGHYEAINRNYLNYYLSAESVALFTNHLPKRPSYIVGQIVHIECQTVKPLPSSVRPEHVRADQADDLTHDSGDNSLSLNSMATSNPYGLSIGREYFVVTLAMLPDAILCSAPPS